MSSTQRRRMAPWRHFGAACRSLPNYGPDIEFIELDSTDKEEDNDSVEVIMSSGEEETEGTELTEDEANHLLDTSTESEGIDPVKEQGTQEGLIEAARNYDMMKIAPTTPTPSSTPSTPPTMPPLPAPCPPHHPDLLPHHHQ